MTLQELLREVVEAAERSNTDAPIYGISAETYRMWKANAGNAKVRRRWRRRNVPNAQKMEHAADVIWRERVEPMQRVPPVESGPDSPSLVDAMRYMTDALRGAQ